MGKPKDGATRTKDGKKQKYNAYTGRWVTQTSPIKNVSKLITSLNLKSRVASEGKEGKDLITKAKLRSKQTDPSRHKTNSKSTNTSGLSKAAQQNLKA